MYYERTNKIEQRFKTALSLIWGFRLNNKALAKELRVSRPTAIRIVAELRKRGIVINVVRDSSGWHYEATHIFDHKLPPAEVIINNMLGQKT